MKFYHRQNAASSPAARTGSPARRAGSASAGEKARAEELQASQAARELVQELLATGGELPEDERRERDAELAEATYIA